MWNMLVVLVLVFIAFFVVLALLLVAGGAGASDRTKQTLSVLESALATDRHNGGDEVVDLRKQELLSAVPWINRWLLRLEVAPRLRLLLYQANLKWTAGGLIIMSIACLVVPAYLIYLFKGLLIFAIVIGLLLGVAPLLFVFQKRKQRFNKFEQELPGALELMVSAMRAGHSFISSLSLVAKEASDPINGEFLICCEEQNYGLELRTAMANLLTRVPLQDMRIVVTAILIQKESGGNLAEVLDKTAYVIRERFRLKRQVRVHTAQGRMTGYILSLLPPVLGVGLYTVNPKTMSVLWTNPLGLKLLYVAVGLTVVGALIIRKIVNMDV